MLKEIKRDKLPTRLRIYDSNWHCGIMIGNIIIFTARNRKETKKIKKVFKGNQKSGFYVEFKKDPVLKLIYTRE